MNITVSFCCHKSYKYVWKYTQIYQMSNIEWLILKLPK